MEKETRKSSLGLENVNVHGRSYVGTVTSAKMASTVVVSWKRRVYVPKYERYAVKTSKVKAHNPDSIDAKEGDIVKIVQCRPLSKTKNFMVVEKLDSLTESSVDAKVEVKKEEKKPSKKAETGSDKKKSAEKKND